MDDVLLIAIFLFVLGLAFFSLWTVWGVIRVGSPFVPTGKKVRKKMIELASLQKNQKVYELGCGSAELLFLASKYDCTCVGYEFILPLVWFARLKSWFLKSNIAIQRQDFFKANLSDADILFCYLLPETMQRIEKEIWPKLKPGTKLISHAFRMKNTKIERMEKIGDVKVFVYVR